MADNYEGAGISVNSEKWVKINNILFGIILLIWPFFFLFSFFAFDDPSLLSSFSGIFTFIIFVLPIWVYPILYFTSLYARTLIKKERYETAFYFSLLPLISLIFVLFWFFLLLIGFD